MEYTNWKEGEDTSLNDGKDCVVMAAELDGKWERRACTEQSQVICKRPPGKEGNNITFNSYLVKDALLLTALNFPHERLLFSSNHSHKKRS